MSRFVRSRALLAAAATVAIVLKSAGAAPSQEDHEEDDDCFGGPPIGPTCGTLTEANLRSLIAHLTLAQKAGLVHGQAETTDPQFGCGNTGQPNAFPVRSEERRVGKECR